VQHAHAADPPVEIPGFADANVIVQPARAILRQHADIVDSGVDTILEREIDDPVLAGKRHRRLGALGRKRAECLAIAASQDERECSKHLCTLAYCFTCLYLVKAPRHSKRLLSLRQHGTSVYVSLFSFTSGRT
jgi:hypothetical protein